MTLLVYFVFVVLAKSQGEKLTARSLIFKNAIFSQGSGGLPMGILDFTQETTHLTNNIVRINGTLTKLTPGHHGIHIHVFGDISDGCGVAGHHFNPEQKNHGDPNDFERHVGDLGNILADQNGISNLDIFDNKIALIGSNSIVGRSVVIHSKRDDLGRGGDMESLKTGNSGGRIGCGIIGVTSEDYKPKNAGLKLIKNANFAFMLLFFYAILN